MIWEGKPRLSVAGVQQKLPIARLKDKFGFGEGDIASTHILKFAKPDSTLILNEYLSMNRSYAVEVRLYLGETR
jgi:serine/threonine-protein kinase HipA